MTAFVGMTAHYITNEWKLVTALLSFDELEGSHSGENQAAHMYKVLKKFNVLDKVSQMTSIISLSSNAALAWFFYW